jgi:Uncharacterized protein conserved in bacteria
MYRSRIMNDDSEHVPVQADGDCSCCRHKHTPRDEKTVKLLENRLNRIIGQLNGIKSMLDDNRYCGDVLTQVAAVESALQSVGYIILRNHFDTCVVEEVRNNNTAILDEALDLIKKLK